MIKILGKEVEKAELELAILLLEGVPKCKNITAILKDIVSNNNDCGIIDRNSYIESILWVEEDVKNALVLQGYQGTQKNIDEVINLLGDDLSDVSIESGWDVINAKIHEADSNGSLEG